MQGIIVSTSFYSVENILNEVLDKYNVQQRYGNSTIHSVLNDIESIDYSKFNIEIHDDASFQVVAEEIKKIVEYGAMPFFEKYQTLEDINEELNELTDENVNDFLSGIVRLKIPLIKKMINALDFKSELIKSKEFYEGEALQYPQYFKNHDKVFFDLFPDQHQGGIHGVDSPSRELFK